MTLIALLAVFGLAMVHLFAGKLRFLDGIPRSRWLSLAGGVSVAYVFIHILPDLSERQTNIEESGSLGITFLEHHVYLMALAGLMVFYGLERMGKQNLSRKRPEQEDEYIKSSALFWLHLGSFAVYNALVGYLLPNREEQDLQGLLLFFFALGFHFVVNDFGLRAHYRRLYDHTGRWLLAAAVLVGWAVGRAIDIDQAALAMLFAFLAGGIVLNVLKEELPEERESRFWAFVLGAGGYAILLLLGR